MLRSLPTARQDAVMRVVVAPDCFGELLTAVEAAAAIAAGWRDVAPADELDLVPMSDGGPGFVEALHVVLGGDLVTSRVHDPIGRPLVASYLVVGDVAYVESAQACGLHLLAPDERDPRRATTYGVGELVADAVGRGVRRVVVGLGGSATNDGGRGLWDALGGRLARSVELVAASDVDNPLLGPNGASAVFGPQKGADRATVLDLDDELRAWADEIEGRVGQPGFRDRPGAGAAGGLGFALFALGGARQAGVHLVAEAVGLADRLAGADLAVTGEGRFDGSSLRGKVPAGVAAFAQAVGVPCVVVAGQVQVGGREAAAAGFDEAYAVADELGSVAAALAAGADGVRGAAARAARAWSR
jgi:glycerate kinase